MSLPGVQGPGVLLWPLRSGSSGNCLLLASGGESVLVDAGWSSQRSFRDAIRRTGVDPARVRGILVSHTHADHVNHTTYRIAEKHAIPLYMHHRNWERSYRLHYLDRAHGSSWQGERFLFRFGETFRAAGGAFEFDAVEIPHDGGACACFLVTCLNSLGYRIAIATDLGAWGKRVVRLMARADYLVVESNWDPDLIARSRRDPRDVARVMSNRGHLSNEAAAALISEVADLRGSPPRGVLLAHLSADHNTMTTALHSVRSRLARAGLGSVPVLAAPRGMMGEPVVLVDGSPALPGHPVGVT